MADHFLDATKKADCISRETAIRFFNDWVDGLDEQINDSVNHPHLRSDYKVCKTQLLDCIHAIKEMPAADVRPVVRARWEDETGYIFAVLAQRVYCPACKSYAYFYPGKTKNFCPTCGADMRPDKNDQRGEKQGRENRKTLR